MESKIYKLFATDSYMTELVAKMAAHGQLWAWMNLGRQGKKALWRIR